VEVEEGPRSPIEDAALLLDKTGNRAKLRKEHVKLVKCCAAGMAHGATLCEPRPAQPLAG
jgi:hypothetical protein